MKILQVLPALNSGGVEQGTVEFARELVKRGHKSFVMSSRGRLVVQLEAQGSQHLTQPVHRKPLALLGRYNRCARHCARSSRTLSMYGRGCLPELSGWPGGSSLKRAARDC